MEEVKIHPDQTEINDFLEDYENKEIYKCRKCQWQTFRKGDYICTNPIGDYFNEDILRVKECISYFNEHETASEDEDTENILWN